LEENQDEVIHFTFTFKTKVAVPSGKILDTSHLTWVSAFHEIRKALIYLELQSYLFFYCPLVI